MSLLKEIEKKEERITSLRNDLLKAIKTAEEDEDIEAYDNLKEKSNRLKYQLDTLYLLKELLVL